MGAVHGKPADDLARADQDAKIVELKRQDLTFQQIADVLGISRASAHRGFHRALPRITEPAASAYRAEHLARLELARSVVLDILAAKHLTVSNGVVVRQDGQVLEDDAPTLAAVDRLVKLDEREAKLLGLDAKTELDHSGTLTIEFVGVDPNDL